MAHRVANAIREQFIYNCNKSMRRRGPGYGEPMPKKLEDQPRPLEYKLYEPWEEGEKAQRHRRVTGPSRHPPVAEIETASGSQQRHGQRDLGVAGIQHHVLHGGPRPLITGLQPRRDPPMADAQFKAAWSQQRHGLQSHPAGGMEPEAGQKLKQLRCQRSKLQHHCGLDADALVPEGAGRVPAEASRRKQRVKSSS